jgi:hypothetical protein
MPNKMEFEFVFAARHWLATWRIVRVNVPRVLRPKATAVHPDVTSVLALCCTPSAATPSAPAKQNGAAASAVLVTGFALSNPGKEWPVQQPRNLFRLLLQWTGNRNAVLRPALSACIRFSGM